ncbi:Erythrocyte membrane protein 1 [Echinococcus multilocularis]|uniref:Erythrocyte membrane protein 1 n=1 Tax=Echinococcus multilocularis TaxID=6211 RepID=A0A0S4MND1_ECHMU|nr:Erythrocyte membrane protein 1 [Echinococcus multilocularis]
MLTAIQRGLLSRKGRDTHQLAITISTAQRSFLIRWLKHFGRGDATLRNVCIGTRAGQSCSLLNDQLPTINVTSTGAYQYADIHLRWEEEIREDELI